MDKVELERFAREQFDCLKDHRFTERVSLRRKGATTNLIWRSDAHQLGICVAVDFDQYTVSVTLAQLERGEWHWPNRSFNTFHESLETLLRNSLNVTEPALVGIEQLQQQPGRDLETIKKMVMSYSEIIKKYIETILQQPHWLLFPQPAKPTVMYMGAAQGQIELRALALFEPLMKAKSFTDQPIFEHEGLASDITWRKGDVGIQIGFEWRDGYVNFYFQRLINGKIPEQYWDYNWEYAKLVHDYLGGEPALEALRHIDKDTPFGERGYHFAEAMLTTYRDLATRTLDDIIVQVVPQLSEKSRGILA